MEAVGGVLFIIMGCLLLIFRDRFVRLSINYQNKFFGFHLGEKEERMGKIWVPIFGLAFVLIGILNLFEVIDWF